MALDWAWFWSQVCQAALCVAWVDCLALDGTRSRTQCVTRRAWQRAWNIVWVELEDALTAPTIECTYTAELDQVRWVV
jgi:hypothetical protein